MKKLTTLENGLRIVTHQMPAVKSVTFGVFNNVGSRDETEEINGTAHFLEHMAFKGTKTRSAIEIVRAIDNVGGIITAVTTKEWTAYITRLLAEDLHLGVDIISDILQNSTFESKELEKERGVILEEIGMYLDNPDEMVFDYFLEAAFPGQPIGRTVLGKKEIIQSIEREKIINFMQDHYHPSKMIVVAAGKVNHDEFVDKITDSMNDLPQGKLDDRIKATYQGGEYREDKKLEQVHFLLGFKGLKYIDKDLEAFQVYTTLMGSGMSSRLFQEIREKRGLVYEIGTHMESYSDNGFLLVHAGTGKNKIKELLPVLCDQLINSPKNLTEEEILKAKAQLKSAKVISMESSWENASTSAGHLLQFNKLIDIEEDLEKIDNVSKVSIERVVTGLLQSKPTIASIGPIKNLEKLENIKSRFI